jgi:hypothetical protein
MKIIIKTNTNTMYIMVVSNWRLMLEGQIWKICTLGCNVLTMHQKKVICKNVTEICIVFTFTHVRQTCFAYSFWCIFFNNFFNGFEISVNSAFFDTHIEFLNKKFFLGHISTFLKTLKPNAQKTAQKRKNLFSSCVLDFNFAPIKGSIFFIF